jgi:general secretion pathway protein D
MLNVLSVAGDPVQLSGCQKVPGLGNLPVLGVLFRGKNASQGRKVLLVLLRPRVIRTDADATRISRQISANARQASDALAQQEDRQYPPTPGGGFPFDGADLNQPFDAGFIDPMAQTRRFPPLPSRLHFQSQ